MNQFIPMSGPADLDALNDYLLSERAPADCMDLSKLDGFLAGLVAGPEPIAPSEWMPVIWDGEEPEFETESEAATILGAIMQRYNDIVASLEADPPTFSPIYWEADDGTPVVEEWAHGFMHAVSLRTEAWETVLNNEDSAVLLIPIGIIAGLAVPELDEDTRLPEDAMEELMEDADMMLVACVIGLRAFWRDNPAVPTVRH
jgi:uncharacterized protein